MPVLDRCDWIIDQLKAGRIGHIAVGAARDPNKAKVKVSLQPWSAGRADPCVTAAVVLTMYQVKQMVQSHVAMDRGHKHSSGAAEIAFWLSNVHVVDEEDPDAGSVGASVVERTSDTSTRVAPAVGVVLSEPPRDSDVDGPEADDALCGSGVATVVARCEPEDVVEARSSSLQGDVAIHSMESDENGCLVHVSESDEAQALTLGLGDEVSLLGNDHADLAPVGARCIMPDDSWIDTSPIIAVGMSVVVRNCIVPLFGAEQYNGMIGEVAGWEFGLNAWSVRLRNGSVVITRDVRRADC